MSMRDIKQLFAIATRKTEKIFIGYSRGFIKSIRRTSANGSLSRHTLEKA